MADKHPFHSDESFVRGEAPVQSFVDPARELTDEERNRPRYGRPARKPVAPDGPSPVSAEEPRTIGG